MIPQEIQLTGSTTKAVHVLTDGCRSIMLLIDAFCQWMRRPTRHRLDTYCKGVHSLMPDLGRFRLMVDLLQLHSGFHQRCGPTR